MSQALCQLQHVERRYAPPPAPPVLQDLALALKTGEIVAVLGASGSGKSTLLNLVGQMDKPDAGEVTYCGPGGAIFHPHDWNDEQRTAFRREHLGFVFQSFNLLPTLTLRENIALPLELNGIEDAGQVEQLLHELDLTQAAEHYPDAASGGEQQRAAIGRALVHRPLLLIADEPTGNLDPDTAERVTTLFERRVRDAGVGVLLATHSERVAACADRRLLLDHGRLSPVGQ